MKLKSLLICAVLALVLSSPAYAAPAEGFLAVADVAITGDREYKAVRLTPAIYAAAQENLADILLSSGDEAVPYFINNARFASDASTDVYDMRLSDSFVKDDYRYFDYEIASPQQNDIRATSLQADTAHEFVSHVELFGGYDGLVWEKVTDEKLYNVSGNRQLAIAFSAAQKYTHYRLKVPAAQEKLAFQAVWLEYNAETITRIDFIQTISPAFSVKQDGKTTVISVEGVKHLPLAGVEIATDTMFKREVSVAGSRQVLYNLQFGGEEYKQLAVPLQGYKSMADTLEIRIDNGDDSPINIGSVTVSYLGDELVFKDPGGESVRLYVGNEQITSPPQYDIGSYRQHILAQGYDLLPVGEIKRLSEEADKPNALDYDLIFNITLMLVAAALAFLITRRLREQSNHKKKGL